MLSDVMELVNYFFSKAASMLIYHFLEAARKVDPYMWGNDTNFPFPVGVEPVALFRVIVLLKDQVLVF